ncbi:MAG: hypothetical protein M0026_22535 [Nocardiopsaceae bacterium]|nr:hypothetical protein [Nocardiopsaceae bacterium]
MNRSDTMRTLCEHPAWNNGRRLVRTANGVSLASASAAGIELSTPGPALDVYDPADLSDRAPELMRRGLEARGPVARLRTPDLWDAIATAIIRQVIRADQARLMYQRFTSTYGEPAEAGHVFPSPEVVLALADEAFTGLGMAFKRDPLRAAAQAVLDHGEKWEQVPPSDLVGELQSVPRIGPWTAGAAVADFTGDFSLYPYGDMAVRKYARQTFPDLDLPDQEAAFAACWSSYSNSSYELSVLTALTLALGGDRAHPLEQNEPS